jgi:hypothetical protein
MHAYPFLSFFVPPHIVCVSSLLSIAHGWVVCASEIPLDLQIVIAVWEK